VDAHFVDRRYAVPGGITVAADVGGDPSAPAVILLHGIGQTRHSWRTVTRELLSQGYHVINLDARGHGKSDWASDSDYTLDALAADVKAVAATLPSAPTLVGASMGGATALCAVGEAPAAVARALVLVDIVPRVDAKASETIRAFMRASPRGFASVEEAADTVAAYYPHRQRPADASGLMKNLRRRDDGRLYWHWDPNFLDLPWRTQRQRSTDRLLRAAARVCVPTLLVRGLRSDIVSDSALAEFRRHMPRLEVCDVSGAGHMVVGDKNDAFNRCVISFLHQHSPTR
jgi:pimeloyl-ACP methyl ester carboxylesterase